MRFYGNEICCCSYACLNAVQDSHMDLQKFELSTSVPFGIRHIADTTFDRLLTTYCDPNRGVDEALTMWGYRVEKYETSYVEEAVSWIRKKLPQGRLVLGPIDMGGLTYQVMPALLKRMDHYIVLEYWNEDEVLCTDSEGVLQYRQNYEELKNQMDVSKVPEADHKITFRQIKRQSGYSEHDICEKSILLAKRNLQSAEQDGQGSQAILDCCQYLMGCDVYQWVLPLLYDIEYLKQRKNLQGQLLDWCRSCEIGNAADRKEWKQLLTRQEDLLGKIYKGLLYHRRLLEKEMQSLAWLEKELALSIF